MHHNLQAYYKIKKVAEGVTKEEHIYIVEKMIRNLAQYNELKLLNMQYKLFGWNIFKWRNNYYEYNRYLELVNAITNELNEILIHLVEEFNKAVVEYEEECAKEELESKFTPKFVVKGFQPPKKKRKRKKKDE